MSPELLGHFWQGRFGAVAMDEGHLRAAVAYVALNPVRARLVDRAQDWPWSSVHAHLSGCDDGLTAVSPVLDRYPRFAEMIDNGPDEPAFARLRRAEGIGRPLGDEGFIASLEAQTGRLLKAAKPGPKAKAPKTDGPDHSVHCHRNRYGLAYASPPGQSAVRRSDCGRKTGGEAVIFS